MGNGLFCPPVFAALAADDHASTADASTLAATAPSFLLTLLLTLLRILSLLLLLLMPLPILLLLLLLPMLLLLCCLCSCPMLLLLLYALIAHIRCICNVGFGDACCRITPIIKNWTCDNI